MRGGVVLGIALLLGVGALLTACTASNPTGTARTRHHTSKTMTRPSDTATPSHQPKTSHGPKPSHTAKLPQHHGSGVSALARGPVSKGWRVTRIVDGDTADVTRGHRTLTLRFIGIDTPETVDPSKPIQCYGPQASAYAHRALLGERVALEFDRSQGRKDYYNRTLAYVWVLNSGSPWLFNERAIRQGYAREYTYDTYYAWRTEFVRAEQSARERSLGLWGKCN